MKPRRCEYVKVDGDYNDDGYIWRYGKSTIKEALRSKRSKWMLIHQYRLCIICDIAPSFGLQALGVNPAPDLHEAASESQSG